MKIPCRFAAVHLTEWLGTECLATETAGDNLDTTNCSRLKRDVYAKHRGRAVLGAGNKLAPQMARLALLAGTATSLYKGAESFNGGAGRDSRGKCQ